MHTKKVPRTKSGFTLIELLVVVAIISLLASIIFASLSKAKNKAYDAKAALDLSTLETALTLYYNSYGNYPSTSGTWVDSSQAGWSTLGSPLMNQFLPSTPVPAFPSIDVSTAPGFTAVQQGYAYWYGTPSQPRYIGMWGAVSTGNTTGYLGCIIVEDGVYADFVLPPPEEFTPLTLNDGGYDPGGIDGSIGVVSISTTTSSANCHS